jgi:hypothetical protein
MSLLEANIDAELNATTAWSRRVRRVGGFIQVAFATFWLVRGSLNIAGAPGMALAGVLGAAAIGVTGYGIRVTAGTAPRPTSPEGRRIERAITIATIIQLAASLAVPVLVIAAGYRDWVLPSIAITIGPLLLWLDHRVHIPRYRPVGWADRPRPHDVGRIARRNHRHRRRSPPAHHRRRRVPRPRPRIRVASAAR